jgi:ribosomal 30S subunit maturation factor RimM
LEDGNWVAVGRILRERGRLGELTAEIYSSQPGRAEKLKNVVLRLGGRERPSEVENLWHHNGRPVFKFFGIDSISEAQIWRGDAGSGRIFVRRSDRLRNCGGRR